MVQARKSGIEVWFKEDIENIILAVDQANRDVAKHIDTPGMAMCRMGFEAALEAVSATFGIAYERTVNITRGKDT